MYACNLLHYQACLHGHTSGGDCALSPAAEKNQAKAATKKEPESKKRKAEAAGSSKKKAAAK